LSRTALAGRAALLLALPGDGACDAAAWRASWAKAFDKELLTNVRGDGVGLDILSFNEEDDAERFVEVNTTGLGKLFPFYVTANEVRCSEDRPAKYRLYRVFNFTRRPKVHMLSGALSVACRLRPVQFRGVV